MKKTFQNKRRIKIREETRKRLSKRNQKHFDRTLIGMKKLDLLQRRLFRIRRRHHVNHDNIEIKQEKPMGNPSLFQGDIILTEMQIDHIVNDIEIQARRKGIDISDIETKKERKRRRKRAIVTYDYLNWTFPIHYYVDKGVDEKKVDLALAGLEEETCVRFKKNLQPEDDKPGLKYYYGKGCWSFLGKTSDSTPQDISIGDECDKNGVIQHETAHALGVYHQQARPDRDNFVSINISNIIPNTERNFIKESVRNASDYGIAYDYGSAMHYRRTDFSMNGDETINSKTHKLNEKSMGQVQKLSFNDIKLINYKYCNQTCTYKKECYNGGYQNPNDCDSCKCSFGWKGITCQEKVLNHSLCGIQEFEAMKASKKLTINGAKDCYYYITAKKGYKINVHVLSTKLEEFDPCYIGVGVEVKYKKDKTSTGIKICGNIMNQVIKSEDNNIIIHYQGVNGNTFNFSYIRI
uniref:Zinc metalloproteinase n=1 Tax=Parastrongyloides trichosuri TaxID=131310 RepID=A0A0N5A6P2_PARTI